MHKLVAGRAHNQTVAPVQVRAGLDVSSGPLGLGIQGTLHGSKGRETPDDNGSNVHTPIAGHRHGEILTPMHTAE